MLISGDSFEPFYSFKYGRLLICMHYKFMPPVPGGGALAPFFRALIAVGVIKFGFVHIPPSLCSN